MGAIVGVFVLSVNCRAQFTGARHLERSEGSHPFDSMLHHAGYAVCERYFECEVPRSAWNDRLNVGR